MVSSWFWPAITYPVFPPVGRSAPLANMAERLADEFDFRIVASDRMRWTKPPYAAVAIDAWNQVGKAQVYYLSPRNRSTLARLFSDTL